MWILPSTRLGLKVAKAKGTYPVVIHAVIQISACVHYSMSIVMGNIDRLAIQLPL